MKTLSAIIIIIFFSAAVFAQAGELDSTFGGDGKVSVDQGSSDGIGKSVAIQSDGKIVVAGVRGDWPYYDFAILRFNTNGSLDSSFGSDGIAATDFGFGDYDYAHSVCIQADGKIVAAGQSRSNQHDHIALARYDIDGNLDNSFGTNGKVITVVSSMNSGAYSVVVQPDGKIVVSGFSSPISYPAFTLVRYNINGTRDSTFGTDGIVTTKIGSNTDMSTSIALQSDGKIIAGGYSDDPGSYFALVRYNNNGTLDSSFSNVGILKTKITFTSDQINSIVIQPDGKIVAIGSSYNYGFALARYNANGALDNSFNNNGTVTTILFNGGEVAYSGAIQSDGKIIAAGKVSNGSDVDFALARYNISGTLDSTFGTDGKLNTSIGLKNDIAYSVAVQEDEKIVAVGYSDNFGDDDFALARYLSGLELGILNFSSSQPSPLIYPNPIHQTETLEYTLTKNESLTIALYDVNGRLIRNFISNEEREAGEHKETLNIGELTSGNYFLTISNGEQKMSVKMVKQ